MMCIFAQHTPMPRYPEAFQITPTETESKVISALHSPCAHPLTSHHNSCLGRYHRTAHRRQLSCFLRERKKMWRSQEVQYSGGMEDGKTRPVEIHSDTSHCLSSSFSPSRLDLVLLNIRSQLISLVGCFAFHVVSTVVPAWWDDLWCPCASATSFGNVGNPSFCSFQSGLNFIHMNRELMLILEAKK